MLTQTLVLETLFLLTLMLFFTKAFGEVMERLNQPALLGELAAGILLGHHFLNFLSQGVLDSDLMIFFSKIGIMFLFFIVGYEEVDLRDLKDVGRPALIVLCVGLPLAYGLGFTLGQVFNQTFLASLFLGLALSITSVAVGARILMDLGKLRTDYGLTILNIGVLEAILALFALSILTGLAQNQDVTVAGLGLLALKIIGFFLIAFLFANYLLGHISKWVDRFEGDEVPFATVIMLFFGFGYLAIEMGMDAIIGAFIAGIMVSEFGPFMAEDIKNKVQGISYGIFIPIFFAIIGAQVDFSVFFNTDAIVLTAAIVTVAILGKITSGFIGGQLAGFSARKALVIGSGLTPRTGVELAVISVALSAGVISEDIFAAIVAMVAISVLAAPILLKITISQLPEDEQ